MAKNKKKSKKRNISEKKLQPQPKKSVNPFEIHLNRQKHKILGQKSKNDRGLPGVSRAKAIKKRKETLLHEFKTRNKANTFIDRRIGEKDSSLSTEDKMFARFSSEKKKHMTNIYNLNDEEELTHYGQTLSEIEKFEDPRSDSEDEDQLGADFVENANFGGFLKKTDTEQSKSRAEMIEDMIVQSKKKKYEQQAERAEVSTHLEKLDDKWSEVKSLMDCLKRKRVEESAIKSESDGYDILVRELKFESRGTPTDKLKTTEELAMGEKNRLEKLEAERLRRMTGLTEEEDKPKHKSADDLDDGFALDDDDGFQVSYNKEGKLINIDQLASNDKERNKVENDSESEDEDEDEDEEENEEEEEDEINNSNEDSDDHSDLESDDDMENDSVENVNDDKLKTESIKEDLVKRKKIMEAARKELPYTFKVSETCEELSELLSNYSIDQQIVVIERMIKTNHPSLNENNKSKLENLFVHLLQYIHNKIIEEESSPSCLKLANEMKSVLYELNKFSPEVNGKAVLDIIQEKQQEFGKLFKKLGNGNVPYPHFSTIYLFQLIQLLYPASDLRHTVITPTLVFIFQIITSCKIESIRDVFIGFYICRLCQEYVRQSKRYIPEVIYLLQKGLSLGLSEKIRKTLESKTSYKVNSSSSVLFVGSEEEISKDDEKPIKLSKLINLTTDEESVEMKFLVTKIGLNTVKSYMKLYAEYCSFNQIFLPIMKICEKMHKMHPSIQIKQLCDEIMNGRKTDKLVPLVWGRRKPPSIKLLEPKIEEDFDGRKKKKGNKTTIENQKLMHKYKLEMKGAIREIRKDNKFLAEESLKGQLQRDDERKRKVKKLFGDLADQEGDYKAMKRKKNGLSHV